MPRVSCGVVSMAAILLAGCSTRPAAGPDGAASDAGADDGGGRDAASGDGGSPEDAGADGDADQAGGGPAGCVIRDGEGCRAVSNDDVVRLVEGEGVRMPGAAFSFEDGSFVAAASSYDTGRILLVRSRDLRSFSEPEALDAWPVSDCTGAVVGGRRYLYFVGALGGGPAGFHRVEVTEGAVGEAEAVAIRGTEVTPYWPQAVGDGDGVLLGFVESQTSAWLATSGDGASFEAYGAPLGTDDRRGVLLHVGRTAGGRLLFTHQTATPSWLFTAMVSGSSDGLTWSEPVVVDEGATNVHDAFPVARLDRGADLYFLEAGPRGELNVFRRSYGEEGALGPVQGVTSPEVGHVEKPQARRLPDGRLALMFAVRRSTTRYDIGLAILDGDAPTE